MMSHTFQCLLYCLLPDHPQSRILIAACGPYILTFDAPHGLLLSTWPVITGTGLPRNENFNIGSGGEVIRSGYSDQEFSERPQKRHKVYRSNEDFDSTSAEIVVGDTGEDKDVSSLRQVPNPPVIKLAGTSTGQHIIAVTGEDKCVRVFKLSPNGVLNLLSQRVMPKRPCAISLTSDDSSILCADKFGDVYFLPLLGQSRDHTVFDEATKNEPRQSDRAKQQSFGPSANSLTVHTKRNRDALRQQQKLSKPNAEKKALNFDHQLLLGHVSLLTDIASVTLASSSTRKQSYILTSDRDEHIRVSRGIPQAHIIEGYCLGHTEFVSKLCVIPTHSHLLISGGGDGYLLLWEWLSGTLKQKIDLKNTVEAARIEYGQRRTGTNPSLEDRNTGLGEDSAHTLSVSNIQILRHTKGMSEQPVNEIIVTCEGVPALFMFILEADAQLKYRSSFLLEGNVIDVAVLEDQGTIIYSMDVLYDAFSATVVAGDQEQRSRPTVDAIRYCPQLETWEKGDDTILVSAMRDFLTSQSLDEKNGFTKGKSLRELIYSLGSLRKRSIED